MTNALFAFFVRLILTVLGLTVCASGIAGCIVTDVAFGIGEKVTGLDLSACKREPAVCAELVIDNIGNPALTIPTGAP